MSNSTIQHLDLASNAIEDQGATAIARALATNTTLVKLELQRNGISSVGVRYMAEALKHNTTLESLGFAFNGCGDLVSGIRIANLAAVFWACDPAVNVHSRDPAVNVSVPRARRRVTDVKVKPSLEVLTLEMNRRELHTLGASSLG